MKSTVLGLMPTRRRRSFEAQARLVLVELQIRSLLKDNETGYADEIRKIPQPSICQMSTSHGDVCLR